MAADDFDIDEIRRLSDAFGILPSQVRESLRDTINETTERVYERSIDEIAAQVNIAPKRIREKLRITQFASNHNPTGVLSAKFRGWGLRNFDARQEYKRGKTKPKVPGGISVQVKAGGSRKLLPGAFFIKLENDNHHMAHRWGRGRNEFEVLYGPSVSQTWQTVRHDTGESLEDMLEMFSLKMEKLGQ